MKGYTVPSDTINTDGSNNANYLEWHTGSGITSAPGSLPGWKSSQECEGGSGPVPCVMKDGSNLLADQGSTECEVGAMDRPGGQSMSNNSKTDHGEYGSTTLTGKGSTLARVTQDNDKHKCGAIHEDQGLSTNDLEGIKYCPGGELPRYDYVSYKPSSSKKKDWVLNMNPGSED